MRRLLLFVAVSTLFILGLHAQNSASRLMPVGIKTDQEKVNLTGYTGVPMNKSEVKTKLGFVTKKSGREDVATITLNVIGDPWEDGTGFQLLLDAHAEIVDHFWDWFWVDETPFYENSEYKIPENATITPEHTLVDGTGSVDIPGGVYDFVFFRPLSFMVAICNWAGTEDDIAMADNYTFLPGFEYIFTIEQQSYVVFETPIDIKLSKVILPQPSLDLTDQETVSVIIYNGGTESITGEVELSYQVNASTDIVTEPYSISELAPGDEIAYTFNTKADFSTTGFHKVEASINYEFDSNPFNNTVVGQTKKFELIQDNFIDEFDTENSMLKWSTYDGNGDGYSWQYDNWLLTDADGGFGCLQVLCQSYGADEYLITDPIAMASSPYELSFYSYRLGNDDIKILYGTTPNVEEMELLKTVIPNSSEWEKVAVRFSIETPGNYFFAFHYDGVYSADSRGVNFDKFTLMPIISVPDITLSEHQLTLYPNPVSDVLNIELKDVTIDKISIYNSLGKIVYTTSEVNDDVVFTLNTTDFAPGFYFISVQTKTGLINKRFVVE